MRFLSVVFIFVSLIFSSCELTEDMYSGETVTMVYELKKVSVLQFHDNFNIQLIQGSVNKLEVVFGDELIDNIVYTDFNDTLNLYNYTKARWLYNFKTPKLRIHFDTIERIWVYGCCKVWNEDTIKVPELFIWMIDDLDELDVLVKTNYLNVYNSNVNTGNYILKGEVDDLNIWSNAAGYYNASHIIAKDVSVRHCSRRDMRLNVERKLVYCIENSGDIYYKGEPDEIIKGEQLGSGELIPE